MNFMTLKDLNNTINKNIQKIPKDVDLVVGIPRSGLFIANLIALYLNLPLTDINSLLDEKIYESGSTKKNNNWINNIKSARKILVVEDSSATGKSLNNFKEQIKKFKYKDKIVLLTIYVTNETKKMTDIYFEICELPRMFEWNYMHHKGVINACFDIDGVLCEDPTEKQNDDGEKYIDFIKNAPVRIVPTFTIGCLVTSRLEKYRDITEEWLKRNNIKYQQLIMMNLESKEERQKSGNHAEFKALNYKKMKNMNIFIESNEYQAKEIARISKKTVFCVDTQEKFDENIFIKTKNNLKKNTKKIIKSLLPTPVIKILKKIIKRRK